MSKKLIIYIIASIVILGIGITYAWITWGSEENTAVEFTIANVADVVFSEGTDITSNDFAPTLTSEKGEYLTFSIKNRSKYPYNVKVSILPETFPTELREESLKYEVYTGNSEENINNKVSDGNFLNVVEGTEFTVAEEIEITSGTTYFKVVIWIDGNMDNPLDMRNQRMVLKINVDATSKFYTDVSGANAPELFEGMIPVMWDSSNNVVKADYNDINSEYAGYDYSAKKWANAVMVTSETRENYMGAEPGTTIATGDILAYWVWIPRYNYELFNANFTSGTQPQTINIEFVDTETIERDNPTNGNMYTHPAFSFGTEEEGYTELEGFWVAKFEPSGTATVGSLKVLPGVASLRSMTVGAQYNASQLFADPSYLTESGMNQIDSHMMKNTEWGAVAYLSHSIYGNNAEITINSNSGYITGGGSGTSYITNVAQSTTGTVYGVYDMSGNSYEYVMGNYNMEIGSSDLTMTNINRKYIDIYEGTTIVNSILGDATGETAVWYGDFAYFVTSTSPWFYRGGVYNGSSYAGAFSFHYSTGGAFSNFSFRPVLSAK